MKNLFCTHTQTETTYDIYYNTIEPIAKVLKREEFVIPTKAGVQSFQYVAKFSGFPFARE